MSTPGFGELILLFIIGLLILGPERLPRVASQVGRWVGRARRTANQLRYQLEREVALADIKKPPKKPPTQPDDEPAGGDENDIGGGARDEGLPPNATGDSVAPTSDPSTSDPSTSDASAEAARGESAEASADDDPERRS